MSAAPELPCPLRHTVLALPKSELALQGDLAAYTVYKFENIKQPKEGPHEPESGPFLRTLEQKMGEPRTRRGSVPRGVNTQNILKNQLLKPTNT